MSMITSGYDPTKYDYSSSSKIPQIPSVKTHESVNTPSGPIPETKTEIPEPEASSVTNNDTMQDGVLHDSSSKTRISHKNPPTVKKKVTKATIQIRDFPRDVMDIVRGIVPGGNSYVETLLAYIYVTSPTKFDIPPNVQAIVDAYEEDDKLSQVFREIRLLREQIRNVEVTSYQGALASEYHLFRSMKNKDPNMSYSDVDYLPPGVEDIHIALENSAKQLKKKDNARHGRK